MTHVAVSSWGRGAVGVLALVWLVAEYVAAQGICRFSHWRSSDSLQHSTFDRLYVLSLQVTVDRPDVQGRVRILKVHSRGKQIGKDVDFEKIARRTPGNTGVPCCASTGPLQCIEGPLECIKGMRMAAFYLVGHVICHLY